MHRGGRVQWRRECRALLLHWNWCITARFFEYSGVPLHLSHVLVPVLVLGAFGGACLAMCFEDLECKGLLGWLMVRPPWLAGLLHWFFVCAQYWGQGWWGGRWRNGVSQNLRPNNPPKFPALSSSAVRCLLQGIANREQLLRQGWGERLLEGILEHGSYF